MLWVSKTMWINAWVQCRIAQVNGSIFLKNNQQIGVNALRCLPYYKVNVYLTTNNLAVLLNSEPNFRTHLSTNSNDSFLFTGPVRTVQARKTLKQALTGPWGLMPSRCLECRRYWERYSTWAQTNSDLTHCVVESSSPSSVGSRLTCRYIVRVKTVFNCGSAQASNIPTTKLNEDKLTIG